MSNEEYEFLHWCECSGFNHDQMSEITQAIKTGLPISRIKIMARKEFNYMQMRHIRYGLVTFVHNEPVLLYARKEYDYHKMYDIRMMLENDTYENIASKLSLEILEQQ